MIIVTGGAGFIGSHLVDKLIEDGKEVLVIDNFSTGNRKNLNNQAKLWRGNQVTGLQDYFRHPADMAKKVEVIFHLAAKARIQPSFNSPRETYEANSSNTIIALEMARHHNARLIYAGSSTADGDVFLNPYAYTKWLGEQHCKLYNKHYEVEGAIARFYNVYGPRHIEKGAFSTVIGIFERQWREGKPLTITGDGKQRRDFCLTSDASVLMADNTWKSIAKVKVGDLVVSFDEMPVNRKRKFKVKPIIAVSNYYSDNVYKIVTDKGCIYATGNHPWLDCKGKYRSASYLIERLRADERRHIKSFGEIVKERLFTKNYQHGYIVGSLLGDGYFTSRIDAKGYNVYRVGLAVSDREFAERFDWFMSEFGVETTKQIRNFKYPGSKQAIVVQSCKKSSYEKIVSLMGEADWNNEDFCCGFLASIYDGEGEYHNRTLRISNKDVDLLERIKTSLTFLGFDYTQYEKSNGVYYIQLLGGKQAHLKFVNIVEPSIMRKRINFEGKEVKGSLSFIKSIEKLTTSHRVYNIEVSDTHTYIANGLLCHNTHVDDIVSGLVAMSKENWNFLTFHLGSGKNYTINEVAGMFKLPIEYIPSRPGEVRHTHVAIKLTTRTIGWKPTHKLEEYIAGVIGGQ